MQQTCHNVENYGKRSSREPAMHKKSPHVMRTLRLHPLPFYFINATPAVSFFSYIKSQSYACCILTFPASFRSIRLSTFTKTVRFVNFRSPIDETDAPCFRSI